MDSIANMEPSGTKMKAWLTLLVRISKSAHQFLSLSLSLHHHHLRHRHSPLSSKTLDRSVLFSPIPRCRHLPPPTTSLAAPGSRSGSGRSGRTCGRCPRTRGRARWWRSPTPASSARPWTTSAPFTSPGSGAPAPSTSPEKPSRWIPGTTLYNPYPSPHGSFFFLTLMCILIRFRAQISEETGILGFLWKQWVLLGV